MGARTRTGADFETVLNSPPGSPFGFRVAVRASGAGISFEVSGADPSAGPSKTRRYLLPDRGHQSYTEFFEGLAGDFGSRTPGGGRKAPAPPDFRAPYQVLLTENLAPGMLYGYGDPAVLRVEGRDGGGAWYYLVATSNDAPDSFPLIRSRDLLGWEFVGFVFPRGRKPAWAADGEFVADYWAPELHRVGGEFRVYFVARDRRTRELCIGVAKSRSPEGPFEPAPRPILRGDVIDPHVFVEDDGGALLFWKKDNNAVWPARLCDLLGERPSLVAELLPRREDQVTASFLLTLWPWARGLAPMERFFVQHTFVEGVAETFADTHERLRSLSRGRVRGDAFGEAARGVLRVMRTPVYARRLSPDGLSLVGRRTKVLENDQPWEGHLVEGVWVTKQAGKYHMLFAANDFSTSRYGIGAAVADSPLGPYRKMEGPLLRSTPAWTGPGHPSVAVGPEGRPRLFLHAYSPGRVGYKQFRALLTTPLVFDERGVRLP
ncbi:MAG TPA: glycoside hydrolase family 43 protein [Pyrinomonadaceae bacterium]